MDKEPRNIVLLSDGTGNSRGKHFRTNVWRVYEALDLADPKDPKTPRQFAFYDDGVGSSSFKPLALLGGAIGFGLARNVRDLYQFLCRTYRDGDRIYAFGFSRGAFTIRVLIGLIMSQGLVKYQGDEGELQRLSKAAYRAYRYKYTPVVNYLLPLRRLRDALIGGWARLRGREPYRREENRAAPKVEFLGLWDTVDAYGLPVDELMRGIDKVVWPGTMRDLKLDRQVKQAVHALALDDERNAFHPRLWDESCEADRNRIRQVWFAGMHSDVGGGYADQGLSHVSLDWVMTAAENAAPDRALRLRFVERVRSIQRELSDENGPMNDSRRGLAGYYRYNPRRLERLYADAGMAGVRPKVHMSALRRIAVGQDAYAPIVLPRDFDVAMLGDTRIAPLGHEVIIDEGPTVSAASCLKIDEAVLDDYARARERVFNRVWLRRVVYFATFGFTAVLLGRPLLSRANPLACESSLCGLSPLIERLGQWLPDVASPWITWYARHPSDLLLWASLVALGLWLGGVLQGGIGDAMRRVWSAPGLARPSLAEVPPVGRPTGPIAAAASWVQWLRTHQSYQAAFRLLTLFVLPGVFLIALFGAVAMTGTGLVFAVSSSGGWVCKDGGGGAPLGFEAKTHSFDIKSLCSPTGLKLDAGGTYEILALLGTTGSSEGWSDGTQVPADLRGVQPRDATWEMRVGTLLRRSLPDPWLLPMARIGHLGTDVYPLRPDPSRPVEQPLTVMRTRLVARSSGELFLHVNDAVWLPGILNPFYENNHGRLHVCIAQFDSERPLTLAPATSAGTVEPVGLLADSPPAARQRSDDPRSCKLLPDRLPPAPATPPLPS